MKKGLVISITLSVLALILIITLTAGDSVWQALGKIDPVFLFFAFLSILGAILVRSLRIHFLAIPLVPEIKLGEIIEISFVYHFVNNVTPFTFGGIPAQIYLLSRKGLSLGQATGISVMEAVFAWGLMAILGPVLFLIRKESAQIIPDLVIGVSFGALSLAVLALFIFIWKPEYIRKITKNIRHLSVWKKIGNKKRSREFTGSIKGEVQILRSSIALFLNKDKSIPVLMVVFTLLYWAFYFMITPLLLLGLGLQFDFIHVFLMQALYECAKPLVPTPGGSGGTEALFAILFSSIATGGELAAVALTWKGLTFYLPMIIGGLLTAKILFYSNSSSA